MAAKFTTPDPLPKQQPTFPIEIQTVVTKAQVSLARLNQLITTLPNPKVLVRPILRKEAYGTSALEGIYTDYKKLVIPQALVESDRDSGRICLLPNASWTKAAGQTQSAI